MYLCVENNSKQTTSHWTSVTLLSGKSKFAAVKIRKVLPRHSSLIWFLN